MTYNNNKKRSHTQLDSRKQVIAFQLTQTRKSQLLSDCFLDTEDNRPK